MTPMPPESPPRKDLFRVGEVVGDLEIKAILGAGGMGQVFEAHDRALNRRVAVKAAWPHVPKGSIRKEAQALAAIRHPSMIGVYALGNHGGIEYVVMERVYGVSLESHMSKRREERVPFTLLEVVEILGAMADGLAVVHRAGVAHRDVKPENVMLAPGNRLILMDFGIFMAEFDAAHSATITGSPLYMAPETILGTLERGSAYLVDMYALGVIAFELLTGAPPFQADSIAQVLGRHLEDPVPEVTKLRPECPPSLAALVSELLAKKPHDRPQTMDGVASSLRRLGKELAAPAPPATRAEAFSILVVDDDREIARLLGFWAKKAIPEAEIVTVHDAEAAIESVHRKPPDVMLLDLHMPKMNGIEVCMYLRGTRLAEQCTIVSVSAGAQQHDISLLHLLGITLFIAKDAELSKKLTTLLKSLRSK